MNPLKRTWAWLWWTSGGLLTCAALGVVGYFLARGLGPREVMAQDGPRQPQSPGAARVEVAHPRKGEMDRFSNQPGKVYSYESVPLEAKVSGYMKTQTVDIGSKVEKDQPLITIAVPELEKQVEKNVAALKQADAHVRQVQARIDTAKADLEAAKAEINQADANLKSAVAWRQYRDLALRRMTDLFATRSIEEKLVDESKERATAAAEAENAARAAVTTANSKKVAAEAKVAQAEADRAEAEAEVDLAKAELDRSKVMVDYATIRAPFNGVVTQRGQFPGSFVRAADGSSRPLLTVDRTDKVRVVVFVADPDVPFASVGDPAHVRIDALDRTFDGCVSRIAQTEDPSTCLMRVEIDLDNPNGEIRQGMHGNVKIDLETSELPSLPRSCLAAKVVGGKAPVFVVRDGKARQVTVEVGALNSKRVAVTRGLDEKDVVILHPQDVTEGQAVTPVESH